ncbi:MFS transporter [Streptomyces smaragdinus]|uniref:MFS transporter n=1 Tax=Streptomyces smaragdinus TaxID=2585196 RepID=UPI002B216906|nr:MFS transporter [Streptomyces smaragdinus]
MSYRELATRPVLIWSLVTVAARLPVAMTPLAVVFLVRERPGGYGLGAVLAALYVFGEVAGAALLGPRVRPGRARRQLALGLATGAASYAGLGLLPGAHPVVLGVFAVLAGLLPAAASGCLRMLLQTQLDERQMAPALSYETMLNSGVWALAPAVTAALALQVAPQAPQLLSALLMFAAAAGLWALPAGWHADDADRAGASVGRLLARAWPVFVTGCAAMTLLALAELVLPALLEQRGVAVGWSGPLLASFALASAVGAFGYGVRVWPGRPRTQGLVLLLGVIGCVAAMALVPGAVGIGIALTVAGGLQSGVLITRNLRLRERVPVSAHGAGYSVMYAASGAGYGASAVLSGVLLTVASPSVTVLVGVGLTLAFTAVAEWGERRPVEPAPAARQAASPVRKVRR